MLHLPQRYYRHERCNHYHACVCLPQLPQVAPAYSTDVFHSLDNLANDRVKAVIAANEASPRKLARAQGREDGTANDRLARAPTRGSP